MEYTDLTLTPLEGGASSISISRKTRDLVALAVAVLVGGIVLVIVLYIYKVFFEKFSNTKNDEEDEDEDKKNVLQKAEDAVARKITEAADAAKAAFGRFI